MAKSYARFMDEISAEELYVGLLEHGLFADRLPPIFDGAEFRAYCQSRRKFNFANKPYNYARFNATRNNGTLRAFGLPVPMAHERLCECLRYYWPELRKFFASKTKGATHKKSGIHLKKRKHTTGLLRMQYSHPECECTKLHISMGKRYLVRTDIAQCFPSIYSHTVPWALVGKTAAKDNWSSHEWYNRIESRLCNSMNGETRGILIGPHTSNVLSEVILCAVDYELQCWDYLRMIDDYECYVDSEEDANRFLLCLSNSLKKYGLAINPRKTTISQLPAAKSSQWIYQVRESAMMLNIVSDAPISWTQAETFLHKCIQIMSEYDGDASILFYGLKVLAQKTMTRQAERYLTKTATSLALLYPYLVQILDRYVYSIYDPSSSLLSRYLSQLLEKCLNEGHLDAVAHTLQMAAKYYVVLKNFDVDELIKTNDCIVLLCGLLYCRQYNLGKSLTILRRYANQLNLVDSDMERFWPFVYECLSIDSLRGEWKELKRAKVSFLREEYKQSR